MFKYVQRVSSCGAFDYGSAWRGVGIPCAGVRAVVAYNCHVCDDYFPLIFRCNDGMQHY